MSFAQNLASGPQAALHLAVLAKNVLGSNESVKCLLDGSKTVFIKDLAVLLNNVDIEHPVGHYLVTVCQTFSKKFGSGVKTLLSMIGLLTQAALDLQQQGVALPVVIRLMQKYIEMCIMECEKLKIPISTLKSKSELKSLMHKTEKTFICTNPHESIEHECSRGNHYTSNAESDVACRFHNGSTCMMQDFHCNSQSSDGDLEFKTNAIIDESLRVNKSEDNQDFVIVSDVQNFYEPKHSEEVGFQETEINFDQFIVSSDKQSELKHKDILSSVDFNHVSPSESSQPSLLLSPGTDDEDVDNFSWYFESCPPNHHIDEIHTEMKDTGTPISTDFEYQRKKNIIDVPSTRPALQYGSTRKKQQDCSEQSISKQINDNDFDSCFDDIEMNVLLTCNESLSNLGHYSEAGRAAEQNNTCISTGQTILSMQTVDEDEEFAHCFDDIECKLNSHVPNCGLECSSNDKMKNITAGKAKNTDISFSKRGIKDEKQNFSCDQSFFNISTGMENTDMNNIEEKQYSRKYKTQVESKPLESSCEVDICSVESRIEEKNDRLDDMISNFVGNKKNICSDSILNRSRHFKTIDSSLQMLQQLNNSESDHSSDDLKKGDDSSNCMKVHSRTEVTNRIVQNTHETEVDDNFKVSLSSHSIAPAIESSEECDIEISYFKQQIAPESSLKFPEWLRSLGNGLHCGASDVMQFVIQAVEMQNASSYEKLRLNKKRLHCCNIEGPPFSHSCMVDGVVVEVKTDCVQLINKNQHGDQRALLVNADISPTYRHTGYKALVENLICHTVETFASNITSHAKWISCVKDILTELQISVILCRGSVCEDMKHLCDSHQVLVLENVPYTALSAISYATRTDLTNYITEASQYNVCEKLLVHLWLPDWGIKRGQKCVLIKCPNNILQTFVLCCSCKGLCDVKEQEFWQCASSLSSALIEDSVLPGSGQTEEHCAKFLRKKADISLKSDEIYELAVANILAGVFHEFYNIVVSNSCGQEDDRLERDLAISRNFLSLGSEIQSDQLCRNLMESTSVNMLPDSVCDEYETVKCTQDNSSQDTSVYDNFIFKTEAWRYAMESVAVVLQTDTYIQTGISTSMRGSTGKQLSVL